MIKECLRCGYLQMDTYLSLPDPVAMDISNVAFVRLILCFMML